MVINRPLSQQRCLDSQHALQVVQTYRVYMYALTFGCDLKEI